MAHAVLVLLAVGADAMIVKRSQPKAHDHVGCVVWHSQHKSAGQRIENFLAWNPTAHSGFSPQEWRQCGIGCRLRCDGETWNCEKQTCVEPWNYHPPKEFRMAMRGYVQTLQGTQTWGRAGDGKCVWATMSREPISRLVSAYLYCKYEHGGDWLCGRHRLKASEATFHQFAKHWGNYLFRELLWFPELRALAESRPEFQSEFNCRDEMWVQFKDQLNGGDDIETESGRKNFEAVKDHLLGRNGTRPLYDVVGLLEEWESTLHLFDTFMPMHDHTWFDGLKNAGSGTHNSWKYEDEKHSLLENATHDPVVRHAVAGDLELYNEVIVPLFHAEMEQYRGAQ